MKYRLILPVALVVGALFWTGNACAFETFRLVTDAIEEHEAVQLDEVLHDAIQHDHGAMQHGAIKHDHGAMQHGAMQHDDGAIQYRAIQHGAVQHGGVHQKCGVAQKCCAQPKCTVSQKCGIAQKGCAKPKCGIIQKFGWSHHLGMAQKGCAEPKGGSKGCTLRTCHLQAACVKIQCAAMNFHYRIKEHCDTLKARLCYPKCCCESKCTCGGKYVGDTYDGDTYDVLLDENMGYDQ